jgi:hypothetical protein
MAFSARSGATSRWRSRWFTNSVHKSSSAIGSWNLNLAPRCLFRSLDPPAVRSELGAAGPMQ